MTLRAAVLTLLLALGGCADAPSPVQPGQDGAFGPRTTTTWGAGGVSLAVTPPVTTLDVGDTRQLRAEVLNPQGRTLPRPIHWTSTEPSVATVDASGRVTALTPGTTTVLAHSGSLSATASVTVQTPLPGPVAHFPLDGTAADVSGNGRDGVIIGGVTPTAGSRGVASTAMLFDGVSACPPPNACGTPGYIEFGNLDLPGAFTLAAWVKPEVRPDGVLFGGIVGKFTLPGNWDLNINYVTRQIVVHTSTTAGVFSPSPVLPDVWLHIVATYDGSSTIKIYTDGSLVATGSGFAPAPSTSTPPRIGRSSWGGNPYKGAIDDVRIYDVELSASEVARLYGVAGA